MRSARRAPVGRGRRPSQQPRPALRLPSFQRGARCLRCCRQRSHRPAPRRPACADPRPARTGARASRVDWPGPAGCGRHQRRWEPTAAPFGCRRSGATAPARRRRRGTRPAGGTTPPSPKGGDRTGCAAAGSTSNRPQETGRPRRAVAAQDADRFQQGLGRRRRLDVQRATAKDGRHDRRRGDASGSSRRWALAGGPTARRVATPLRSSTTAAPPAARPDAPPGAALESAPGRAVAARRFRRRGGGARRGRRWKSTGPKVDRTPLIRPTGVQGRSCSPRRSRASPASACSRSSATPWSPAVRPLLAAGLAPRELARGRRGRGVRICGGPATRPSTPSAPLMSIKIGFRPRC